MRAQRAAVDSDSHLVRGGAEALARPAGGDFARAARPRRRNLDFRASHGRRHLRIRASVSPDAQRLLPPRCSDRAVCSLRRRLAADRGGF